jgi:hypothetical protein
VNKRSRVVKRSIALIVIALMASPVLWAAKLGIVVSPKEQFNHQNITEAFHLAKEGGGADHASLFVLDRRGNSSGSL